LSDRLHSTADRLRGYADTHDRTRIALNQSTSDEDTAA
jgi:hypothetical protein